MLIFIISVIAVSIISLCFFKNKFWENRYLVLLISGGVALVATLATNFSIRGHLTTKTEIIRQYPIKTFFIKDSLLTDTIPLVKNVKFDFNREKESDYLKKDTLNDQRMISVILYDKLKYRKFGYIAKNNESDFFYLTNSPIAYIASSESDTLAYIAQKKLVYDIKPSKWITGFTFPRRKTYRCFYVPPKEYAAIVEYVKRFPNDSSIIKLPF
jgi:hypothetical protein